MLPLRVGERGEKADEFDRRRRVSVQGDAPVILAAAFALHLCEATRTD